MVKKTKEETTKKRKAKVGTGAWWKTSAVTEETTEKKQQPAKAQRKEDVASAQQPEQNKQSAPAKKRARSAQKSHSKTSQQPQGKRSSREKQEKTEKDPQQISAEESAVTGQPASEKELATEQPSSPQPEAVPQKRKRSRGRRGKKNTRDSVNGEHDANGLNQAEKKEKSKETPAPEETEPEKKSQKLLINAEEPEECRLALLEDGRLESIHVSTAAKEQRKNNIYKARVVAVEPSLQAAFVDYGTEKNGFLPFGEIHPEYFKANLPEKAQELIDKQQWKKLSITEVVERGQELLVQVVKEEVGKKGANMTTFLSIPGRCVVLMPGSDSSGISRKISGEQRRSQLRDIMKGFTLPEGVGWIVRTASVDITENALSRDVDYLSKLWADIRQKGQQMKGVGLLYEDHQTVSRFLREHFDPAIEEILVDDRVALDQVKDFISMLPKAQQQVTVRLHQGMRPIFNQYSVEDQIESIYQPQVNLPSGGSIVINPTEALVAIDVNSGSTSKGADFEESIFQANLEAATEIARQLRLRDLGGLVVVDFIDMRSRKHINAVEKQIKQAMKRDKAKVDFSRISKFGLMQISRQKLGAPIESGNYRICEYCKGRGMLRSIETLSLYYLRRIQTGASRKPVQRIDCHLPMDVAAYLLNNKRVELSEMEKRHQVEITITAETRMKPADNEMIFHKKEKDSDRKNGRRDGGKS